jgi:signal transduction histidine kinase
VTRILAIDDKQDNLTILSAILRNLIPGCTVLTARSGLEGIEKAKCESPDTILLDIKMPGMDGYEICRRLKEDKDTKHIPVILISAILTSARDRIKGLDTGADAYLAKPVDEHILVAQVKTALRMKAAEDSLRRQKDILEDRVRARTAELVDSNVQLKREIDERRQAELELEKYRNELERRVAERTLELQEIQEQLVRKEKLAVLGQLAAGVGHEIRNPLGAIKNVAYFLNMQLENPGTEISESLEILNKEVAASEKIIDSLFDYADPKTIQLRPEVNINEIIQESLGYVKIPADIEMRVDLTTALPAIEADSEKLSQVFRNLIRNAVQAMPEGGRLTVVSQAKEPGSIEVTVQDTGEGISRKNCKKIYEPLYTTRAKGIGLGLALCKIHVEAHGGEIGVESEPGQGAVFTVKIPGTPATPKKSQKNEAPYEKKKEDSYS